MSHNNHNKTIKNIGAICLSVIVFALIYNVLLGGNGFNAHMAYGRTSGYGLGGSLNLILALVIKLLFLVIIVAVVAGVVTAIKNQGLDNIDLSFIDKLFDNRHHRRHLCPHCQHEIEHHWKNCPYCGSSTKKESKKSKNATPAEDADRQVESQQASVKTKTEPKNNGKTKK
jgi:uncharacterized membrane protein